MEKDARSYRYLLHLAERAGLQVAPRELQQLIIARFKDGETYRRYIAILDRHYGVNAQRYEDYLRDVILFQKVFMLRNVASYVTSGELADAYHQRFDRLELGLFKVHKDKIEVADLPGEDEARAYFEKHAGEPEFIDPAKVRLAYIFLPKEKVIPDDPSESDVRKYYN
ncbi:MAG: hypothetical protein HQL31_13925, partial [Planctomycetes bacterium]|nr:hypothetical protein [Planctomycetota bacterium]